MDINHALESVPFLIAITENNAQAVRINLTRVLEALIIAAASGLVTLYAGAQVLENRLGSLERNFDRVQDKLERLQQEIYRQEYPRAPQSHQPQRG